MHLFLCIRSFSRVLLLVTLNIIDYSFELGAGGDGGGAGGCCCSACTTTDTLPSSPSTVTCDPSGIAASAPWHPATHGFPASRHVMPACESAPPFSVTTAPATPITRLKELRPRDRHARVAQGVAGRVSTYACVAASQAERGEQRAERGVGG
jgi:hypothetical protein